MRKPDTSHFFTIGTKPLAMMRGKILPSIILAFTASISAQVVAQAMLLGDEAMGEKHAQEKCSSCHVARFGGDGNEIYTRKNHRVTTVEGLMQQVQFCNANTGAGFSEEQQDDIIAYLNAQFYRFGDE